MGFIRELTGRCVKTSLVFLLNPLINKALPVIPSSSSLVFIKPSSLRCITKCSRRKEWANNQLSLFARAACCRPAFPPCFPCSFTARLKRTTWCMTALGSNLSLHQSIRKEKNYGKGSPRLSYWRTCLSGSMLAKPPEWLACPPFDAISCTSSLGLLAKLPGLVLPDMVVVSLGNALGNIDHVILQCNDQIGIFVCSRWGGQTSFIRYVLATVRISKTDKAKRHWADLAIGGAVWLFSEWHSI